MLYEVITSFANGDVSVDNKPTVVYELPNDYRMKLIAYNDRFGCSDTSSVVITAHPLPKIEIIKDVITSYSIHYTKLYDA